jgi:2-oxoisovalerate dehydrogenase E1 component
VLGEADFARERAAQKAEIDALVDEALAAPEPSSSTEQELGDVFAPKPPRLPDSKPEAAGPEHERRYVDAISDALRVAMRRDERVVLLGQDIASTAASSR